MPVTAVRDEGALRMWVCRLPVHIDPAECTGFTEIFGEFVTSHWADRVVGPYNDTRSSLQGRTTLSAQQNTPFLQNSSANS